MTSTFSGYRNEKGVVLNLRGWQVGSSSRST